METRWYYAVNDIRPSSRPPYRKRLPFRPNLTRSELFETDHVTNNPVESIVDKVSVLSLEEWKALSEEEKDKQFFCESFYSTKTGYIHPLYGGLSISISL